MFSKFVNNNDPIMLVVGEVISALYHFTDFKKYCQSANYGNSDCINIDDDDRIKGNNSNGAGDHCIITLYDTDIDLRLELH